MPRYDLTGKRFGRLVVLGPAPKTAESARQWRCRCDCGNESTPSTSSLTGGTQSCGCLAREISSRKRVRTWTAEELAQLESGPIRKLATLLGRSQGDVQKMRLKVRREAGG